MPIRFTTTFWPGVPQDFDGFIQVRRRVFAPHDDRLFQVAVVPLGVDNAELIFHPVQLFQECRGEGGLAAPGSAGDEDVPPIRGEPNLLLLLGEPQEKIVADEPGFEFAQVTRQERPDELQNPFSPVGRGNPIGPVPEQGDRIGHRRGAFAEVEKGVIVFAVSDSYRVVPGEAQFRERGPKSCGLVDPGRKNHHGSLVEDELQFQAQFPDRFEHLLFIGIAGIHDDPAHRQGMDSPFLEALDETIGGPLPQELLFPFGGAVQHGPVLGHNPFENAHYGEYGEEVVQLPPGHENELPARRLQPVQAGQDLFIHAAILGYGVVIVAGEDVISHEFSADSLKMISAGRFTGELPSIVGEKERQKNGG